MLYQMPCTAQSLSSLLHRYGIFINNFRNLHCLSQCSSLAGILALTVQYQPNCWSYWRCALRVFIFSIWFQNNQDDTTAAAVAVTKTFPWYFLIYALLGGFIKYLLRLFLSYTIRMLYFHLDSRVFSSFLFIDFLEIREWICCECLLRSVVCKTFCLPAKVERLSDESNSIIFFLLAHALSIQSYAVNCSTIALLRTIAHDNSICSLKTLKMSHSHHDVLCLTAAYNCSKKKMLRIERKDSI